MNQLRIWNKQINNLLLDNVKATNMEYRGKKSLSYFSINPSINLYFNKERNKSIAANKSIVYRRFKWRGFFWMFTIANYL